VGKIQELAPITHRRGDIQGLRAVAVLLVVVYHAGLGVSGGFSGVDVFFVISGFVITTSLLDELAATGRLSLPAFYRRRVKRLLPALAVMVFAVAVLATFANPVGSQRTAALTGIWASLFSSNAFLYRVGTGYFDVSGTLNPLLHTWTLAVEEQFYIVFPVLLFIGWRVGRRVARSKAIAGGLIASVSAGSFLLSLALSHEGVVAAVHRPMQIAFYSSPTRAWEFGAGALLALCASPVARLPNVLARALGIVGAGATLYGAFSIPGTAEFPGTAALYPVLGTTAIIAAGTAGRTAVSRLLAVPLLNWMGDRSYSWYLWHWPIIVFAKALVPGAGLAGPVGAAVSLLPAAMSYRWIENPVRRNHKIRGPRVVALAATCVLLAVAACFGLLGATNLLSRTAPMRDWQQSRAAHADELRGCEGSTPYGSATPSACTWNVKSARGRIVLIGDSNASHFAEPVIRAGNRAGYSVTLVTFFGCPFVDVHVVGSSAGDEPCRTFYSESMAELLRTRPNLVVTAARTDGYIAGHIALGATGRSITTNSTRRADLWRGGLTATLSHLNGAGIPVLVVEAVPEVSSRTTECAVVLVLSHSCSSTVARALVDARLRSSVDVQGATIAASSQSYDLNLESAFCSSKRCYSYRQGRLLYRDSDHLSVGGSLLLTDRFYRAIVIRARHAG
jgi:peptidoglycan/LPS O-acetylase OafA/YrhL